MPSKTKSNHVITTKADLEHQFQINSWQERLSKCRQVRVDKGYEFASNTRSYRRQQLVEHYEDDLMIAFTIEYTLHDGNQIQQLKMLLIDGMRHIVP